MSHTLHRGCGVRDRERVKERRVPHKPHHKPHRMRALRCNAPGRSGTKIPYTSKGCRIPVDHPGPLKPYSMFCTCSRICSTAPSSPPTMSVSSSAADLEPSVLASRCSSWIRKSSRLPTSPPALQQPLDLVQVRRAAAPVPRPRRCGSRRPRPRPARAPAAPSARHACCAAPLAAGPRSSARGSAAAGAAPPPAPAARPAAASSRRRCNALHQHRHQPLAFARARLAQALDAAPRRVQRGLVQPFGRRAPRHHCSTSLTDRRGALGSQPCTVPSRRTRRFNCSALGLRPGAVGVALGGQPQLDLAAPEARPSSSSRSAGSSDAQFVGQAQRQVEKTAVDRARFDAHRAAVAERSRRVGRARRPGAGVTGHAVNCHRRLPLAKTHDYVKAQTCPVAVGHGGGRLPDRQEAGGGRFRRGLPGRRPEAAPGGA